MSTVQEPVSALVAELVECRGSDWLLFSAPVARRGALAPPLEPAHETWLAWNAGLPGAAKFVLTFELQVSLQAELPADHALAAGPLHAATIDGLFVAQSLGRAPAPAGNLTAWPALVPASLHLTQTMAEVEWPVTRPSDQTWLFDLGGREDHAQAQVAELASGALLLWSELVDWSAASGESQRAIARLLLLAGGLVRWVRPALYAMADRHAAGFEILLPPTSTAAELVTALSALAVGCQHCAADLDSLLNETVALEFIQATTPVPFRSTHN